MKLRRKHLLACLQAGTCARQPVCVLPLAHYMCCRPANVCLPASSDLTDWLPLFWLD